MTYRCRSSSGAEGAALSALHSAPHSAHHIVLVLAQSRSKRCRFPCTPIHLCAALCTPHLRNLSAVPLHDPRTTPAPPPHALCSAPISAPPPYLPPRRFCMALLTVDHVGRVCGRASAFKTKAPLLAPAPAPGYCCAPTRKCPCATLRRASS